MKFRHWILTGGCLVATLLGGHLSASGFALIEQSVSAMGNAYAGAGTSAYDASILYFNPAGITKICGNQAVGGFHFIIPSSKFTNDDSIQFLPPNTPLTGGNGGNAGKFAAVPHLYAVSNWNDCISYGIGINSPFGLSTVYEGGWVGRYHALKSALLTININPTIAYRFNDCLSIGAGFNAMYLDTELTNAVDFGSILQFTFGGMVGVPQGQDGSAQLKGDSWGWGGNVGILWDVTPCTRLGVSYRSQIKQHLKGNIKYKDVPAILAAADQFQDAKAEAEVVLPDTVTLSAYQCINSCFAVMADVTWTHWSLIPELKIDVDGAPSPIITTLKWKDSWRYAVGASYFPNQCMTYRVGFAYDATPIPNAELRTPRIPGEDRYWLALGGSYQWNRCLRFDFGYAHLFVPKAKVDKITTPPLAEDFFKGGLRGHWDQYTDIVSVQADWNF